MPNSISVFVFCSRKPGVSSDPSENNTAELNNKISRQPIGFANQEITPPSYCWMGCASHDSVLLKQKQHALGQTSTSSAQHHPNHVSTQTQHQLHQQTQQSVGIAVHPTNGLSNNANSVLHDSNTGHQNAEAHNFPSSLQALAPSQTSYATNALPIPFAQVAGLLAHNINPFETYSTPYPVTPRFLPIMSYPQPVYVPYPFVMPPDMIYPSYPSLPQLTNNYEDSMSRGAGSAQRPASTHSSSFPRNSPIFYVRLPPTPYMFLPSLGLGSSSSTMASFPNFIPMSLFSSIFNVPSIF
ncbi:hypothetical protein EVAR_66195_1 [Eumeta japonica]|uniref:Uncharacterized protein n=1 Tax=Eumeta variegata TaxID=151549 RepID=A0A4C2A9V7_EUMVA|nr:hypothetical protein EVAR_66195_1 [Eumeta japonica]